MSSQPAFSSNDDLNSRARLRDAAIIRFASDGMDASLRSIAADAGFSAASLIKHFGSKEQLRAECDTHVLAAIRQAKYQFMTEQADPNLMLLEMARIKEYGPLVGYALRSLLTGGEAGREFFEGLVDDAYNYLEKGVAVGILKPSRDPYARARYLISVSMGAALLSASIDPDVDFSAPGDFLQKHMDKTLFPALEAFTEGIFTDRQLLDTYLESVNDPAQESTK